MHIDDLKIFAKNQNQNRSLDTNDEDLQPKIGMEFGIKMCSVLVINNRKSKITKGLKLPYYKNIRKPERNILEVYAFKHNEKSEKVGKEYLRN